MIYHHRLYQFCNANVLKKIQYLLYRFLNFKSIGKMIKRLIKITLHNSKLTDIKGVLNKTIMNALKMFLSDKNQCLTTQWPLQVNK